MSRGRCPPSLLIQSWLLCVRALPCQGIQPMGRVALIRKNPSRHTAPSTLQLSTSILRAARGYRHPKPSLEELGAADHRRPEGGVCFPEVTRLSAA